jgi:hypothetical protein
VALWIVAELKAENRVVPSTEPGDPSSLKRKEFRRRAIGECQEKVIFVKGSRRWILGLVGPKLLDLSIASCGTVRRAWLKE